MHNKSHQNEVSLRRKCGGLKFYDMDGEPFTSGTTDDLQVKWAKHDKVSQYFILCKDDSTGEVQPVGVTGSDIQTMIRCYYTKNPDPNVKIITHGEYTGNGEDWRDQDELIETWLSNGGSWTKPKSKAASSGKPKSKSKPSSGSTVAVGKRKAPPPQSVARGSKSTRTPPTKRRHGTRRSPRFGNKNKKQPDSESDDGSDESTPQVEQRKRCRQKLSPIVLPEEEDNDGDDDATVGNEEDGSG